MILILEGVSGSGKTSLAKILKRYGFAYFKDNFIAKRLDPMLLNEKKKDYIEARLEAQAAMVKAMANADVNVILDRFHLSEWVYGYVERGYSADYVWSIDEALAETGDVRQIILTRNTKRDFANAEEEALQIKQQDMYTKALDKTKIPTLVGNASDEHLLPAIRSYIMSKGYKILGEAGKKVVIV